MYGGDREELQPFPGDVLTHFRLGVARSAMRKVMHYLRQECRAKISGGQWHG